MTIQLTITWNDGQIWERAEADRGALALLDRGAVFRCTKRVLDVIGMARLADPAPTPSGEDWYTNLVWCEWRMRLLLTHAGSQWGLSLGTSQGGLCKRRISRYALKLAPSRRSGSTHGLSDATADRYAVAFNERAAMEISNQSPLNTQLIRPLASLCSEP
jgi:hypothetical protein